MSSALKLMLFIRENGNSLSASAWRNRIAEIGADIEVIERVEAADRDATIHPSTRDWDYVVTVSSEPGDGSAYEAVVRQILEAGEPPAAYLALAVDARVMIAPHGEHAYSRLVMLTRRRDMSGGAFSRYWHDDHGALVLGEPTIRAKMRGYVQNHVVDVITGSVAAYDGIVETQYETLEDTYAVLKAPEIIDRIRVDEERFLDRRKLVMMRGTRHRI